MKLRTLTAAGIAAAALIVPATAVGAGEVQLATMTAMPNPTTVGTPVTIYNMEGEANTCEGSSEVIVGFLDPSSNLVDEFSVTPDGSGNWSATFTPTVPGLWTVLAECVAQEAVFPDPAFSYANLLVDVFAQGTTSVVPTTAAPSSTSTTAAAAATVTPAFTG